MTKYTKYVILGIFLLLIYALISQPTVKKLEKKLKNEEEFLLSQVENAENKIDFSVCNPSDSLTINLASQKSKLTILGLENDLCKVTTSYTLEGLTNTNNCEIPISVGEVSFIGGSFAEISKYCQIENISL